MTRTMQGVFWVGLYLGLSLLPLLLVQIGETPPGRDFWTEFSVALGFVGLAMIGLQFAITARFRRIAAPYGLDIMLRFHRQISLFACAIILAHPLILFVAHPEHLALLDLRTAPWRARAGVLALVALGAIVIISLGRQRLRIEYEGWRLAHGLLGVTALALALFHVVGVGYYLSLPWKRALWGLMGVGALGLLLYVRILKPVRMLTRPYEVVELREERGDAHTIALRPVGHGGLNFRPGQFAWLTAWHSPFAVEEHPFSVSSSATEPERPEFTIKVLGDFTRLTKHLVAGSRAYLDGPYGAFTNDRYRAGEYVFIAGGIGITPLMSMLRTAADTGDTASYILIYANKTWEEVTFRDELSALGERLKLEVVHVLEEAHDGWEGETGFVDAELLRRYLPAAADRAQYFVCGPPPMLDAVDAALGELEVPPGRIHIERFDLV